MIIDRSGKEGEKLHENSKFKQKEIKKEAN